MQSRTEFLAGSGAVLWVLGKPENKDGLTEEEIIEAIDNFDIEDEIKALNIAIRLAEDGYASELYDT